MAPPCPTDAALESFARGAGDPSARAELSAHIRGCAHCQARYLPMALQTSALEQTNFDSPAARARKISRDTPAPSRTLTDSITAVGGLEDTHVSGERSAEPLTTSGIQRGEALDRYVILDRLGAGGMGEVYSAWDPVLDRKVAVKVLRNDFEGSELSEELTQRLLHEAQSLAKLSHPNVVTVHDVGLAGARVFLAMEFAEGRTLKQWLEQKPRPTWRATLEVFLAAGEGLAAAHAQGITHRDFKPDNVIVGNDGRVRVMDFGLAHGQAKKRGEETGRRTITQPGAMLGTPAYMSLEALHGQQTDFRSDEFCFCASLYEGFYGYRPFEGDSPAALAVEIAQNRVRATPKDTKVPRRIHELVVKGLRADPAERFQTMRALLVQLGRRRATRERSLALGAIAVLAVLTAGLTGYSSYRSRTRCAEVETRLDSVWDPAVKQAVKQAFEATQKPWAAAAWRDVEARLDAYGAQWVQQRRAACEGSLERDDEQLGQEIVCLSRRLSDLDATAQLFAHADAEVVERAVSTAGALPPLAACREHRVAVRRTPEGETARARLSAIRARIDAGKYGDALAQANQLAASAEAEGDRGTFGEAKFLMALAQVRTGDWKTADALVEEAILAAAAVQDDALQARGWVERVGFAALGAPAADADRWVRFARAALERAGTPTELESGLANNLGVLSFYRGEYAQALEAHRAALKLRTQLWGAGHPLTARSHSNLGIALKHLGRLDEARAAYEQALAIEEQALDPSHPQVADTLNNLGNVLYAQRSLADARRLFERSLRIKEGAYGPDSLPVAVTLSNLGALLLELPDLPAAEAALQRAVEIKEQRTGPDALTVAISLTNLSQARRAARRYGDALALDQRALAIRRVRQGEKHPDLAYNLNGVGEAKVMLKDLPGARKALEEALALRRERGPVRAETAYWLAQALTGTRDTRRRSLLEEAVADIPPTDRLAPLAAAALRRR